MEVDAGTMTPSRPYLLRAVYDWIVDNGLTPQILVDAEHEHVAVPKQYVNDGRIVLNLSPSAVRNLVMGNDAVSFSARFGGQPFQVSIPTQAVRAVVARENGVGMSFPEAQEGRAPLKPVDGSDVAGGMKAGNERAGRSAPQPSRPESGPPDEPPASPPTPPSPGSGSPKLRVGKEGQATQ
ncbi:MAG: ClpXP protease specificity-enhancing factor [Gammaproteobacteria bacterium]